MGKKSSPPPPPDYVALENQRAANDKAAAAEQTVGNRPNQVTPWGESKWSKDSQGNWTENLSLNPADQSALDAQRAFDAQRQGIASTALNNVSDSLGKPLSFEGLPEIPGYDPSKLGAYGSLDTANLPGYKDIDMSSLPELQGLIDSGQLPELKGLDLKSLGSLPITSGGSGFSMGGAPDLMDIDLSGLDKLDPSFGAVESVRDAMMGRMAPQRSQLRESEIQRLKNQGITENSEAWTRALKRLDEGDTDALQQALLGGMGAYGDIFNRGLAKNNQYLQGQQARAGQRLANRGQLSTEAKYGAEESRLGADQAFNQSAALRGMKFDEMLANAKLGRSDRSQLFDESMARSGESRANRGQLFDEEANLANLSDRRRGQTFGENAAVANFNNSVRDQQYGEQEKSSRLAAALRQQGISERETQRQSPLNDFLKLTSGIDPQLPQMPNFMSATGYNAADPVSSSKAMYDANVANINASNANKAGLTSGLLKLFGTAMPLFRP